MMEEPAVSPLHAASSGWCLRAGQAARSTDPPSPEALDLVREGIQLRRRWDVRAPEAPLRRRLLRLLAELQNGCRAGVAALIGQTASSGEDHAWLCRAIAEDAEYLASLAGDPELPQESLAFALECFRDDVFWLGGLAAAAEGGRAAGGLGRILREQEALERVLDAWQPEVAGPNTPAGCSDPRAVERLHRQAAALRALAIDRQAEGLLQAAPPTDVSGWYDAWQAASRLLARMPTDPAPRGREAVAALRRRAAEQWRAALEAIDDPARSAAWKQAAEDLADTAADALTFLEELPLAEAVRTLELLADDAARCLAAAPGPRGGEADSARRVLKRRQRTIAGELQERRLAWRMESLLGRRVVAALERFVLVLLLAFVVMLVVEGPLIEYERTHWPGSRVVEATCAWIDLGICLVLLAEFTLKFSLARPRWLYFRRNWITGLLPAIPVGFLGYALSRYRMELAGEGIVLLRLLRYLRLPQMARWLRIARPVLRATRLLAFLLQASDRLVRQAAPLLNRNLVLFERATVAAAEPAHRRALAALRQRFEHRSTEVAAGLSEASRCRVVRCRMEDLTVMLEAPDSAGVVGAGGGPSGAAREIPVESVIARMLATTPADVAEGAGSRLARSAAQWCKAFDVPLVRRLPLVRDLVEAGRRPSAEETTALVANRTGALLKQLLDRAYWLADFYGIVTAPQLVDSVGDWLVKGTSRPARRFLMIGLGFLIVSYLAGFLPLSPIQSLSHSLERLVGGPLVILGLLCLVPLCLGLWFRQIAGEASDFLTHVAEAQLMPASKGLKQRLAGRYHAVLERRVIVPEQAVARASHGAASAAPSLGDATAGAASGTQAVSADAPPTPGSDLLDDHTALRTVELLWRDYLDGPPFHRTDTKTATQLLGNLMLVSLREGALQYTRRQRKRLRRLDLATGRVSLRGPYLWFLFISRSLAQQTAKLVVDFNAHALPIARAASVEDWQVRRYVEWLSRRLGVPADQLDLPAAFHERYARLCDEPRPAAAGGPSAESEFHGTDFTAICFLSADPEMEADIARRYGPAVVELMRRDRRDNIRRVFRTYPLHHLPRPERTINLLDAYERHLRGGRVLIFPLKVLWWALQLLVRAVRLLWHFVGEVLTPTVAELEPLEESDPLGVAVRKIHRMRRPLVLECMRMRAELDPEYLGVVPPGAAEAARRAPAAPIEEDLALIDAEWSLRDRFRRLAARRRREMAEFRSELGTLGGEGWTPESLRAMAIAYAVDYAGARSALSAAAELNQAFDEAVADGDRPAGSPGRRWSLRAAWCRWRHRRRIARLFDLPAFRCDDAGKRRACIRLICRRRGPLVRWLKQLTAGDGSVEPLAAARAVLARVGRDPGPWSRQLVVLRTVQTLSVLDLRLYCDLVAELGEYERG